MNEKITIIEKMVKSVQENRNFRQLSCYSLECIAKYLDPLYPEADEFIKKAINCDAVEVILDIMTNYSTHKDVLGSCAVCLCRLEANPEMASKIYHHLKKLDFLCVAMEHGGESIPYSTTTQVVSLVSMIFMHPHIFSRAEDNFVKSLLLFIETQISNPEVIYSTIVLFKRISEESTSRYLA